MTISASLTRNPDLDSWLQIHEDGTLTLFTGKVEIGQGIKTALALIAAEELDVAFERIHVKTADTAHGLNELMTSGSLSMEESGRAIQQVTAEIRTLLLAEAAQKLNVPRARLEVIDGRIGAPETNATTTYWELAGGKAFKRKFEGKAQPKNASQYQQVGHSPKAIGLQEMVLGATEYVHDMKMPGMLHGRVVRPPQYHARLKTVDASPILKKDGLVKVIQDGSFLAVVAEREEQAVQATAELAALAHWEITEELDCTDIYEQLVQKPAIRLLVVEGIPTDDPIPLIKVPEDAKTTLQATYHRPYQMHASIAPAAALALYSEIQKSPQLTIWTHSQGVFPLQTSLSQALGIGVETIRLIHVPGAGCYGHNGADDVAMDAALVALELPERPVLVKWTREDEHSWEPYGAAMVMQLQASLDEQGQVLSWNQDTYSDTHAGRPRPGGEKSALMPAWHRASPMEPPPKIPNRSAHGGIHRNAAPLYRFPEQRIVKNLVKDMPLRTSALRSLGAYANVFALESFMDELAHEVGSDPLQFRLSHLQDERGRAVLEAAAAQANWHLPAKEEGVGRGIAFAQYKNVKCYAAVIMTVAVDAYGKIVLQHAVIAADAGQVVDPDGLENQLEGGLIQAASWTLKEAVTYDKNGITSQDWETYPILTFSEFPTIETVLLNRPNHPYLGSGEATQGPTAAAIANAVFDATGLRLRQIPFTMETVRKAAAGVSTH